jgi:hypothetical protein
MTTEKPDHLDDGDSRSVNERRYVRAECAGVFRHRALRPCGWTGLIQRGELDAPSCPRCGGYTVALARTPMSAVPSLCRCSYGVDAADCPEHG